MYHSLLQINILIILCGQMNQHFKTDGLGSCSEMYLTFFLFTSSQELFRNSQLINNCVKLSSYNNRLMTEKILPIISYDALPLEVFCGNTFLGMKFGNLLEIKETGAGDAVRPHSFEP